MARYHDEEKQVLMKIKNYRSNEVGPQISDFLLAIRKAIKEGKPTYNIARGVIK